MEEMVKETVMRWTDDSRDRRIHESGVGVHENMPLGTNQIRSIWVEREGKILMTGAGITM